MQLSTASKKIKNKIQEWKKETGYKEDIKYNIEKLKTVSGYSSIFDNSTNEQILEATWETNDEKYYCGKSNYHQYYV